MSITQNLTQTRRVNEAILLQIVNAVVVPELLRYPPRSPVAPRPPPAHRRVGRADWGLAVAGLLVVLCVLGSSLFSRPGAAPPDSALLVPAPSLPLPATVPPTAPPATPPPEDAAHITVLPGESLEDVARRAGVAIEALIAANNLRQPDGTPRPVYAGETLLRPAMNSGAVADAPLPTALVAAPPPGEHIYQVQPGDTLNQIAARRGVSLEALVGRNDLANANTIYAGQTLIIPDPAYVPPAWAHERIVASAAPVPQAPAPPPAAYEPLPATAVPLRVAAMPTAAGGGPGQGAEPAPTLPPAPPTPCPTYVVDGVQWYANQALSPGQWELIRPDQLDVVLSTCGDVHREIRKPNLPPPTPHPTTVPVTQETVPPGGLDILSEEPLYRIAVRYGWTVDDLVRANPGLDPTQDNRGRTIHVPAH